MDGWEHKSVVIKLDLALLGRKLDAEQADEELNALGAEGWEGYAVTPLLSGGSTCALVHHLRRPRTPRRSAGFAGNR